MKSNRQPEKMYKSEKYSSMSFQKYTDPDHKAELDDPLPTPTRPLPVLLFLPQGPGVVLSLEVI